MTKTEEDAPLPQSQSSDLSEGSGLSQGSDLSKASDLSQGSRLSQRSAESTDTEMSVPCRICKETIMIDDVKEYTACTKPSGEAHFVSHYVCLGLYPKTKNQRQVIKTATRCPKHSNA